MRLVTQAAPAAPSSSAEPGSPAWRFEQAFRAHSRPILGYALRRVTHREEAADVVSEVMLVAWRRIGEMPEGDEARLWLYGVARRVLANQARSTGRRTRLGERLRVDLAALPDAGEAMAGRIEERAWLLQGLSQLSEEDREVLLLSSWEGLEPTEIALVLDLAPGTVRARLHRARRRLRERLEGDGLTETDMPKEES
jgi:RNA polymerase sigma-70 factor (ECF subfamily)